MIPLWSKALSISLSVIPFKSSIVVLTSSVAFMTTVLWSTNTWVAWDQVRDRYGDIFAFSESACGKMEKFDYIVVGSGAAGMVVATRVANYSKNARVLLLEAGGEPSFFNGLPVIEFLMINQPSNTWQYNLSKQERCCQGCDDNRPITARGKVLGGSTGLNFMMYVRGHPEDFNGWASDLNDPLWNYGNLLPYFKKSEDYHGAYANGEPSTKYHGKGGLLHIDTYEYMPGIDDFLAAGAERGYKVGDYNGEASSEEVFSKLDMTTEDGWRESTYRAFYQDTGKPPNLCIRKYAHVDRINFECGVNGKPKATGVTFRRHGEVHSVIATREVILSAGALESPKLLLLSGIGPAAHLKEMGIPLVKDLPVGQHLQDHLFVFVGPFLKGPSFGPDRNVNFEEISRYAWDGGGVIAAPNGISGVAFLQSDVAQPPYPDLEIIQFSVSLFPESPKIANGFSGFSTEYLNEWFHPYHLDSPDARYAALLLGRTKSEGELRLTSSDPDDNLIIDPNYLSHPDDIEALLYGFKTTVDLYENTAALNVSLFPKPAPGCEGFEFKSDDYYRCAIKYLSTSFYHHVGTCSLGKVVDARLKVKGVDGLRVIDASIMPRVPNANTQAATIMIGEKGAEMVVEDSGTNAKNNARQQLLSLMT